MLSNRIAVEVKLVAHPVGTGGGRCRAWLLLVRRAGDRASHDAKAAPKRGGDRPGARTEEEPYEPTLLELRRRESSSRSKDTVSLPCCQASGRAVRIIHHCESLYPTSYLRNSVVSFR